MEADRLTVVVGSVPPPIAGQSLATSLLLEGLEGAGLPHRVVDIGASVVDQGLQKRISRALFAMRLPFLVALAGRGAHRTQLYIQLGQSRVSMLRDLPVLLIAAASGWRIVGHLHGANWRAAFDDQPRLIQGAVLRAMGRLERLIVLTSSAEAMFDGLELGVQVEVIGNGVARELEDAALAQGAELSDRPRILYLGNLMPGKGVDTVLSAAELPEAADWEFVITGHGDLSILDGSAPNVDYRGLVSGDEKIDLLRSASVLVLVSSLREGEPVSVLEALHFGVPVVSSASGGLVDIVDAGVGRVVPPDDPLELAAAVSSIVSDPVEWRLLSSEAQKRARQRHTSELHVRKMLDLLVGLS